MATPEQDVIMLASDISHLVEPLVGAGIVLGVLLFFRNTISNIVASFIFRQRGFMLFQEIRIDGDRAIIVSISYKQVCFLVLNGSEDLEFRTIANNRIEWANIRRIVNLDKKEPKH